MILSWSSCQDSALSELSDPDGAAMALQRHDGLSDPATEQADTETILRFRMTALLNDFRNTLDAWSKEDLRTLVINEEMASAFGKDYLADPVQEAILHELLSTMRTLLKIEGRAYLEELMAGILSGDIPVQAPTDAESLTTPCYNAYMQKSDLAATTLIGCMLDNVDSVVGSVACASIYTARMIINYRKYLECLNG